MKSVTRDKKNILKIVTIYFSEVLNNGSHRL